MLRLFRDAPEAIEERWRYPKRSPSRSTNWNEYPMNRSRLCSPQEALTYLTYEGAKRRYQRGIPDKIATASSMS